MTMKNLKADERALVPLLIGVAAIGGLLFGGSYLLTGEDPITAFKDLTILLTVGCLLFILGIYLLSGRLLLIPPHISLVAGLGCVIGGPVLMWTGWPL